VRLSFFSSRLLSPESVLLATAAAPFFFLRKGSSRGQRDASGITATTVTIAPKGGKVPVLLGEVLRAPDSQYIIPNSRDLRDIREVLIKMLNSWQYPHRVTSLRNSETGAACVLTSTVNVRHALSIPTRTSPHPLFFLPSRFSRFPQVSDVSSSHVNFHHNEKILADDC